MLTASIAISKKNFEELTARSFKIRYRGRVFHGFVVKKKGKYFAFRNLCQHLPITLDLRDNDFFSHDKKFLQCHMHGATYEIETGYCIAGPCEGAKLVALDIEEEGDQLVVSIPRQVLEG